jgi:hypothetical protein
VREETIAGRRATALIQQRARFAVPRIARIAVREKKSAARSQEMLLADNVEGLWGI